MSVPGRQVEHDRHGLLAIVLAGRERKRADDVPIVFGPLVHQVDDGHPLAAEHFGERRVLEQRDRLAAGGDLGVARQFDEHVPLQLLLDFQARQGFDLEGPLGRVGRPVVKVDQEHLAVFRWLPSWRPR